MKKILILLLISSSLINAQIRRRAFPIEQAEYYNDPSYYTGGGLSSRDRERPWPGLGTVNPEYSELSDIGDPLYANPQYANRGKLIPYIKR